MNEYIIKKKKLSKTSPELRNYMNTIPHLMKKISKKKFFWKKFLPHGKLEVGKGTCLARGGGGTGIDGSKPGRVYT